MTSTHATIAGSGRREGWVDDLRVVVIVGVIVLHAATGYVVDVAGWYYDDERDVSGVMSAVAALIGVVGALFWLGPLFLVAGWLSARSLARRGPAAFLRARLVRLGLPLVVFLVLVNPLTDYLGNIWQEGRTFGSYLGETEVGAMWFVAALLTFSACYAVIRSARPVPGVRRPPQSGELMLAAVTISLTSFATWQLWPLTGEAFANLRFAEWPQGAVLFALGVRAADAGWADDLPTLHQVRRLGWAALAGVLAFLAVLIAGSGGGAHDPDLESGWLTAATAALDGLIAVTWTLWFVVWFVGRLAPGLEGRRRGRSMVLRAAGRASYATYFLHPLVLTVLMVALAPMPLDAWPKFVLAAALAVPACFTAGHALTRLPGVRAVL